LPQGLLLILPGAVAAAPTPFAWRIPPVRLCDRDIERYLAEGRIRIEPHPLPGKINGVSVDLHLGHRFRVFNDHAAPYIDLSGPREEVDQAINRIMSKEIRIAEDGAFFIHPGELALAATAAANGEDWYKLTAKKGVRVLFDVVAQRIDSKIDATLVVYDDLVDAVRPGEAVEVVGIFRAQAHR